MTRLPPFVSPGTWTMDPDHTDVGFSARHAGISRVRGRFTDVTGIMQVGEDIESSHLNVRIRANSIDTRNEARDQHLRTNDFFEAEVYPYITFDSLSARGSDEEWAMVGRLTIKDVSHFLEMEVEFNGSAVDPFGATRIGFSAHTTINRKDFGLVWNAALETGGVLVGDKVRVEIEAEFVRA